MIRETGSGNRDYHREKGEDVVYNLAELYYPITARPGGAGEFSPSKALRPYIRCYWGTVPAPEADPAGCSALTDKPDSRQAAREIIIPDTCMDIIWEWDTATGAAGGVFCGINDTPFEVDGDGQTAGRQRFAIRFHFWAVHLFADEHLRDVMNFYGEVDWYFSSFRKELGQRLAAARTLTERIAWAEEYLLRRLDNAGNVNNGLMNAVHALLQAKGVKTVSGLSAESVLSSRQLERLFRDYIGISPKQTADLVRFQNVWRNLYCPTPQFRNIQDLVHSFGYSDQSHFNNSFKRFAGRTPREALVYAGK
ncbi:MULTISPECIES: helix-turn-helix domain-containing protein [unclassified Paenibacillus]|uniref:helix-turn-helix domain-containing protein n=1 Tax=unclassified Paenibacillus TaxID=185978 RepID=UPI0024066C26|nr:MULTISPECIES: helix-turn-helix domain-containing protein [unclassified Paenibacillus]MDF9844833.1 AraC-like DNA-binding protein [Paenibacillus sp. PastF-2]MDF9851434.1 AraC-like DNA-binding protein [Paenibacillus sp. PastM-2]MDF9858036.1 AraC-like DNA-binding protein [Paenibacillus sp. PastF-1]MDH6483304.1 AraC-like DNA-binding protein [Paenibacillus sp. PastH-2]